MRRSLAALIAVTVLGSVVMSPAASRKPRAPLVPEFGPNLRASGPGTGFTEPSGVTAADGTRYVAYQGGGSHVVKAKPGGPWVATGFDSFDNAGTDSDSGDVSMAADNAGTVFLTHLAVGAFGLIADIDYTRDGGSTWARATNFLGQSTSTAAQPLQIDRPWIAAYSPSHNAADTRVYMEYHDFFDPNAIWVHACSMATGALTCQEGVPVSGPESICNTIPGPLAVAPAGSPNPGRVYAVWVTADPVTNVETGCNLTQQSPYQNVFTAYSDNADAGPQSTWHVKQVFAGPTGGTCAGRAPNSGSCDDNGNLFPHATVDRAGNVYVAWAGYIPAIDPHYDVFVAASTDGGDTYAPPVRVDRSPGVEVMPAIVAGDAGRVALTWNGTTFDSQPYTAADTCPTNTPPMFACAGKPKPQAPSSPWYTYVAFATDAASEHPHYAVIRASDTVMHYGDFCTLGIYCDGSETGNRSLADAITIFPDAGGFVQLAWTDQREDKHGKEHATGANANDEQDAWDKIYTACQHSGPSLYVHPAHPPSCAQVLAKAYKKKR